MSYKRIFFIVIGGFVAVLLMNTNNEVTAQDPGECQAGQYSNESTGFLCVDADQGHYVPEANATEQIACLPGMYQPANGAISCLVAEPGHFVDTTAAVAQTACAPGTYQPYSGAVNCIAADPGYFVDTTASAAQIACAPGFYQPYSGATSCLAADPGYYVSNSAATEQLACPAGYTSEAAAIECTLVEAGYTFTGFFAPVDMAALNGVKAGRAIPIKFSLGGDYGLDIMADGYPASTTIACDNSAPTGTIEETVSAGSSSLSYDPDSDQYTYVWKTNKGWANSCRVLTIMLDDGSVHQASFKFTP
jgi:hypothetical protein